MDILEQKIDALLGSPVGCAFVLGVECNSPPEQFANPLASFKLAADCVDFCDVYTEAGFQELALRHGQKRRDLARRILEHPAFAWWFAPVALDNQIWTAPRMPFGANLSDNVNPDAEPLRPFDLSEWREPELPTGEWAREVQKPELWRQITSTLRDGSTSAVTAYASSAADHICAFPLAAWRLEMPHTARVYEITGPADWHNLCLRYPAHSDDGRLTPDWGRAAADWDGVHLTFGGLLSCEQHRYAQNGQWSQHQFWHAESTQWLRPLDIKATRLPDFQRDHNPHRFNHPDFDGETFDPFSRVADGNSGVFALRRTD